VAGGCSQAVEARDSNIKVTGTSDLLLAQGHPAGACGGREPGAVMIFKVGSGFDIHAFGPARA